MPSNSYFDRDEAERYYDKIERELYDQRRQEMIYYTREYGDYQAARTAMSEGRSVTLGSTHGFVVEIHQIAMFDEGPSWKISMRPTHANVTPSDIVRDVINQYYPKEDSMKVYEGIIVKLDDQGQPADVLKVVAPFVAKDAQQATDTIRTDYAIDNKLSGKDAAALRVRVREFPVA